MVEKIKQALEQAYSERKGAPTKLLGVGASSNNKYVRRSASTDYFNILSSARTFNINIESLAENRIITFNEEGLHLEDYRLLRSKVGSFIAENGFTTVGITSPGTGEGKSLTSVNLAISLSRNPDLRVTLIDGDILNPTIHQLLSLRCKYGFIDVLKGKAALEEVIFKLSISNLWCLPGRKGGVEIHSQIGVKEISAFVSQLPVNNSHVVIFDLPPVLGNDVTPALATQLDGILLVVEEGATVAKNIELTVDLLKQSNLIGAVLNKTTKFW